MVFPDLVALKKITGSTTISTVPAGGSKKATITLNTAYLIIGVPKVSTSTENAEVEVVNGGKNTFTVKAINNGASDTDVAVSYEVYVLKEA